MGARAAYSDRAHALAPLLEAREVAVTYESAGRCIGALAGVSVGVPAGELLGVVGPNGSGKTTLLRALTGVVRLESGSAYLLGSDVRALSQREIARRVAVVPQEPVLPGAFTALEAVLMGRTPYLRLLQSEGPRDMEAAREAMLRTGTWEFAQRPLGELSGGERQRVVVARALAQETPALLLDEPTAHLDIGYQAMVLGLVRELCREEGLAALAVVHDLTLAAQYCDRLLVLSRGRVAAEGDPIGVLTAELVREVYGARVTVLPHPETGRPVVAPSAGGA